MRRYGLYDATRGLMTALAVGLAGLLLWVATQVGVQSTARFWAAMGIVAGGGLVLALLPALGGWTSGLRLRISPGDARCSASCRRSSCAGWILLATQPGNGWHEGRFVPGATTRACSGIVHAIGLWHGALAFGFGVVLGMSLDARAGVERVDRADAGRRAQARRWPRTSPLAAEREAERAKAPRRPGGQHTVETRDRVAH